MTAIQRTPLETQVTDASLHSFDALICCASPFAPVAGLTVRNCLDGSSNLLAGCAHLTRLIADGEKDDAEQTAYCLSFLLEAAKSLLDSASQQLGKGVAP
ncbi:hypothetical protein [Pseudomonas nitroreducens]|uniref:hypothetical protein n=1 Tax=Pseudomonas nitroreducens TaxID=46680 RepID=UPI003D2A9779